MLKKLVLLSFGILCLLVSGCWDRREAEELLLADAIAIDLVEVRGVKQYQITFVSTKPSGGGGGQMSTGNGEGGGGGGAGVQWVASSQGPTLEMAIQNFTRRSPRYTYLGHTILIFIGEDLARDGISETLDFLIKKLDIRLRNMILVTKGNALDIVSSTPEFEVSAAAEIAAVLERGEREGDLFHFIDLNVFTQLLLTPGKDPWAASIHTFQPTETEDSKTRKAILVEETAVFRSDKLVGFLSRQETMGFMILGGLAQKGTFSIDYKGAPLSFTYEQVKVKKQLVERDETFEVTFQVSLKGRIAEAAGSGSSPAQELTDMEHLLADSVRNKLQRAIDKCQELRADVLGIGRDIHIQYPEVWKLYQEDWVDSYHKADINVSVIVEISEIGLGYKPISPRE